MGMYYSSILISCNLHPYLIMVFFTAGRGWVQSKKGDPVGHPHNIISAGDLLSDFYRLQLLQGLFYYIETALPEGFRTHVDPRVREDLFGGGRPSRR